jgi:hypothetical protein
MMLPSFFAFAERSCRSAVYVYVNCAFYYIGDSYLHALSPGTLSLYLVFIVKYGPARRTWFMHAVRKSVAHSSTYHVMTSVNACSSLCSL